MYILPHTTFPEQETPQANDRKNWVRWPRDSSRWFRQNPRLIASIERVSGRNENHHDGRSDYVPGPMDFPVRLRGCTDVDSDVYKCRCQMSTGFPPNVDGNVENISIYHGKKAQKHQNHMLEKCRIICWYIYMYINTQTHTHTLTKRLIFQAFSRGKLQEVRDWLEKMSMLIEKTCKCRTYVDVNGSSKCPPDMVDICAPPYLRQTGGGKHEERVEDLHSRQSARGQVVTHN